jgi:hypothetical protein
MSFRHPLRLQERCVGKGVRAFDLSIGRRCRHLKAPKSEVPAS